MAGVPSWMSADTFEYVLQFTEEHEGKTNFMYNNWSYKSRTKDVTVSVGISLRTENDAVRPDIMSLFRVKATGAPATDSDMRAEFRRVYDTERTAINLESAFKNASPLEIPKAMMRPKLRKDILDFWDQRGPPTALPEFDKLPAQAQVACMSYNYGARLSAAPRMCAALKRGDYHSAAMHSNMPGWDPNKNLAHRVLLMNAGVIVRDGLDRNQLPPPGRFKPPPAVAGKPEADLSWLRGWWYVNDTNEYYYYFGSNGSVLYIETRPNPNSPPPATARNRGTYFFEGENKMVVDWSMTAGDSTVETFYNAFRGTKQMNATSNRWGPLYAEKM